MTKTSAHQLPATGVATKIEQVNQIPADATRLLLPLIAIDEGVTIPDAAIQGVLDSDMRAKLLHDLGAIGAKGTHGEITNLPFRLADSEITAVTFIGLGKEEDLTADNAKTLIRRASGVAARSLHEKGHVLTTLPALDPTAATEGLVLGSYLYQGLKSESTQQPVQTLSIWKTDNNDAVTRAIITAECVNSARDLVNAPSSHLYPESYAEFLKSLALSVGLEVEVLDPTALAAAGFGGILAVGSGSSRGPRLVRLHYKPKNATKKVGLVGKGITFDTGGISLKPGGGMDDMISDMGGSAAMAATIIGAARLELPIEIIATLPLAENMPSAKAYRPGDVITHYGGKTSEILNTDAEGRIVLADALARASEDNPDYILEAATLTGAQLVALGDRTFGVMGTEELRDEVAATGREVDEPGWAMPLPEELGKALTSPVADLRNISKSRHGGMLVAGWYLSNFIGEGIDWVHLDVAGPAYNTGSVHGFTPLRGTGVPVRTLLATLERLSK
ncbi:MAG: leucyl aminopeptidase [Corynebacterium sp.]|nr:leucyl aminopeptidase [Corynebacterium sp.]